MAVTWQTIGIFNEAVYNYHQRALIDCITMFDHRDADDRGLNEKNAFQSTDI